MIGGKMKASEELISKITVLSHAIDKVKNTDNDEMKINLLMVQIEEAIINYRKQDHIFWDDSTNRPIKLWWCVSQDGTLYF